MNDEIKLPPLAEPDYALDAYSSASMLDYARLAVEQDRARRDGRDHEYYSKVLALYASGVVERGFADTSAQHNIILRWTPERVWIESERNRELAQELRKNACCPLDYDAADALDGGQQ